MKKALAAISAAAVIGTASFAAPTPASAHAWWVVPAIVGGALVGTAAVVSSANAYQPYAYSGAGGVYVQPSCRIVRERTPDGWRRVQVCR